MSVITSSSQVTLYFELLLEDGQIVDSNFGQSPACFVFGDGSLLPAFEEVLIGMRAGQEGRFQMTPENGFGPRNEKNIQLMSRSQFSMCLEEGMVVYFADMSKNELPGVIANVGDTEVMVDFNHPLSGHTLTYCVQIIAVEVV